MLHPPFINLITYFYPIGNTPAVCLTQDLPPEDDATALLLGCGDIRNILFTAEADSSRSRHLDLTCCDNDVAILARNILLFSLIIEDQHGTLDAEIWSIAYHLYTDDAASKLLRSQVAVLEAASESLSTWHKSKYGRWLRMCDERTLQGIRKLWSSYNSPLKGAAGVASYKTKFEAWIQKSREMRKARIGDGQSLTGFRSSGPVGFASLNDLSHVSQQFWKHGTVAPDLSKNPNPTFFGTAGNASKLHYGTDPLLGFHLALAYIPLLKHSPFKRASCSGIVSAVQAEFRQWCKSFRERAASALILRFYSGDAFAFCYALQHRQSRDPEESFNWYRDQYQCERLWLNDDDYGAVGTAPTSFNIIDTSNLADHLGGLNILTATAPLLQRQPSAMLYLETLVRKAEDLQEMTDHIFCGHLSTVCMLCGLTPTEYWTNATATSSVEEHFLETLTSEDGGKNTQSPQMRSRFVLRPLVADNEAGYTIGFDASALARLLFQIYLDMFRNEDMRRLFADISVHTIHNSSLLYYHRGSFAAFLLCARRYVQVDWLRTMGVLLDLIENDSRLLMSRNYIQELYVQLHLQNLCTVDVLEDPLETRGDHGLAAWKNIPSTVAVTLQIPSAKLKIFKDVPWNQLGTPILQCTLQASSGFAGRRWQNVFSVVQVFFGDLRTSGSRNSEDFTVSVVEDEARWDGKSNLIASFIAPSWTVLLEPDTAQVSLCLQSTPLSTASFLEYLGPEMAIYQATLGDEGGVFITKNQPNLSGPTLCNAGGSTNTKTGSEKLLDDKTRVTYSAILGVNADRLTALTARIDVSEEPLKSLLRDGALVQTVQTGPGVLEARIGNHPRRLSPPVPVIASRSKTRIARKSSYIEITSPLANPRDGVGDSEFVFPLCLSSRGPVPWNMPYLNLDRLPIIDVSRSKDLKWLNSHTALMLSSRERKLIEQSRLGKGTPDPRSNLKDSLFTLFMGFSGLQGQRSQVFGISDPEGGGVHILIFVFGLRLDLANRTPVLDAAVVPLYEALMPAVSPFLQTLPHSRLCQVKADGGEMRLWKRLLPAWIERCRSWKHRPECEYRVQHQIPLSVERGEKSICSCGNGIFPSDLTFDLPRWNIIAKHAVRAAISACFTLPYVEHSYKPEVGAVAAARELGCQSCGKKTGDGRKPLMKCGRCGAVKYCSVECQRQDWKTHKKTCKS